MSDMRFGFFLEEPYDGGTVARKMSKTRVIDMAQKCVEKRDQVMLELKGGLPFHMLRRQQSMWKPHHFAANSFSYYKPAEG
jgi:hypothetical protein